jgi:acylphosphatase
MGRNAPDSRMTVHVTGDVQGVGYRFFAQSRAQRLGLRGYTQNQRDGSVLVVAEGAPDLLTRLLAQLREGPYMANVEQAQAEWGDATGEYASFGIR